MAADAVLGIVNGGVKRAGWLPLLHQRRAYLTAVPQVVLVPRWLLHMLAINPEAGRCRRLPTAKQHSLLMLCPTHESTICHSSCMP